MIDTSRITSGFDVELNLGRRWFLTALNLLNDNGLLAPPGLTLHILDVQIAADPSWHLEISVAELPVPALARAAISDDGSSMTMTTNVPGVPAVEIPFGALKDLAGAPQLVKVPGDADHESALSVLANLNIHAESQSGQPLPDGEFLPRGDAAAAQSFLPSGKDIVFGMGRDTFARYANNIWHTTLRADDGSHPLPDENDKKGTWSKVTMTPESGKIRVKLEGDIPVDSPVIDVVPDPHVTITLLLTPKVADGKLSFSIETDTDVDMGLLGDLLGGIGGAIGGGLIGFIVGLFTGAVFAAFLWGAAIGFVAGVIILEVAEVVVEGIVQQEIKARIDGKPVVDVLCNERGIVQFATPPVEEETFNLSVLDSIPASIAISTDNPPDEPLYKRSLLVTSIYDDLRVDGQGLGVAGVAGTGEAFQPEIASIRAANYVGDTLVSLTYRRSSDGVTQDVPIAEVLARTAAGELQPPLKLFATPEEATLRIPNGRLPCVCMKPVSIHQNDTIVQQIEFENGVRLNVPDAIALQDAGAVIVTGYQLIHPRAYHSYYRAKADFFKDNNFESLPRY